MAENSAISWTENTFNPWIGCTKVSAGCANCYAEREQDHRHKRAKWGPHGTRSLTSDDNWKKPLKWERQAKESGQKIKVFCASLADVFEDWTGPLQTHWGDEATICLNCLCRYQCEDPQPGCNQVPLSIHDVRQRLFRLIDATLNLDWLLVTKRPENIRRFWCSKEWASQDQADSINETGYLHRKNVWLLTSVENQEAADRRIPELLKCRDLAPVLGLSCEPLLGPVDLKLSNSYQEWANGGGPKECSHGIAAGLNCRNCNRLDWVIAGGESGPDARPMHPDWARSLRDQCQAEGVPFHFKQWGEFAENGKRVGKKAAGRELESIVWDEFPETANV